ncbi:aspartic peptidase domain-containing protein [Phyllosticta citricarpa]|uniref:Aspartic peptidase domain-containing protein n=2 Tax=Phyllosticta TaxID=121621 RepID=A0ABR1LRD1_9PEZI
MPSVNVTVLLVALLAALAVAVPNPTRTINRRPLNKRSFKVERVANPNALARTNGKAAMRKVFRKYGWEHPDINTSIVVPNENSLNLTSRAGGLVSANPEDGAALFLSPVNIGGQTLNLDFDSGSSDMWLFSTQLNQQSIGQHTAFNPGQSTTFKQVQGASWQISYGDGSGAAGNVGTDVVNIGGATVTNQAVELATAVSQSFVQDTGTDGLVGLAFGSLNTVKPQPQKTFFENLLPTLQEPVFTADLRNDASGSYEFGRIDQTKFQGQMVFTPVDAASGFWKVDSKFFTIGGKRVENPNANAAIADTGTTLLLVDDNVAQQYYAQVPGARNDAQAGGFTYPCNSKLPDFGVAIGDTYVANVPGDAVTFAPLDAQNQTCFGGVQGNSGANLQIYGDIMFRTQFAVFNGRDKTLGMAPKVGQPPAPGQAATQPAAAAGGGQPAAAANTPGAAAAAAAAANTPGAQAVSTPQAQRAGA